MEAAESLFECLEQVPDPRRARGVRHPFQAILRLTLLGLVCGQTTMAHITLFARMNWPALKEPLGFLRDHPPHPTTISRTLAGVSHEQLQKALTGWVAHMVADLYRLADWLAECGVETVVMESTGVYWIPLFGVLEERDFQVMLVDPRRIKNVRRVARPTCGTASGCSSCTPTACCREPSVPTGTSGACAVTCGSGPCWWSTPLITSSICRKR